LQILKAKLPQEEQKILEKKYAAQRFGLMTDDERFLSAKVLLLKISTITGWTLPISELQDILIDQFQKTLVEKYANVNIEEIEYAFRKRDLDIKDWGKALNLSLVDEILLPYLETRFEISKVEEQKKLPTEITKKELTDEEWNEWIEDIKKYPLELIPIPCYEYLLRTGKINPTTKEKKDYMNKAMPIYAITIQDNLRLWNEFLKQKLENKIQQPHFDSLVVMSKRLIVKDYFNQNDNNVTTQN